MGTRREDRLQLALQASKEGIWDWNLVTKSIYYSPRISRFLGYRKDEMPHLFEDREEHMDEESVVLVDEALRRVIQEGEDLFAVEAKVMTAKWGWKWFRVRGTPVRDNLGRVTRIGGSLIDISKRMSAERELAEERYFIRTLLDNIPMNVYFKNDQSRFVMANLSTAKKMGLESTEELLGKSDADFFGEEHARVAREDEVRIMLSKKGFTDETEQEKWENGPDTWVKTTKHAWLGANGEVKGIYGVTSDVSELVRTKNEQERIAKQLDEQNKIIEEERQLMRLIIDSVPLNVYFKNQDHQFVIVNRAGASWLGSEEVGELYDKSDRDFFAEPHWQKTEEDEKQIMESGEPMVGVIERERWENRSDTWVMTSKYPWRGSEGEVVGTFGVSSDVSDLMRAQRKLENLAMTFEEKNREMAAELKLAREVQLALLPDDFPVLTHGKRKLTFGRFYQPAQDLTGEFFEVVPLGPDKVGFLICEVMGKGVRSALVVSMLRGFVEKEMASSGDAGAFLTGLNQGMSHLLTESGLGIQAMAFYAVADLKAFEIQISMAGQMKPIAVFQDGARQLVPPEKACGPPLGAEAEAEYHSVVAPLRGLQRMVCFTSGVREARDERGEEFGVSRLLETVERGGGLGKLMDRVATEVESFSMSDEARKAICLLAWDLCV